MQVPPTFVRSARIGTPASRALGAALAALVLASLLPAVPAATAPLPPLGMSMDAVKPLAADGAAPRYGSYWVGDWMASSGWGGFDNAMATAVATGATPVVYWYYWGDSISPACVENGCNGRDQAEWHALTDQLAAHLRSTLGGREALVVLENEFNKGGITGTYAPTFDARLEGVAKTLKAVPGVKIVIGYGAWSENDWSKFPRTLAQSDYVGFQMMRGSTRDTEAEYRGAADRVAYLAGFVAQQFDKPSFLYDLALSSYPDAHWETVQAETLQSIFDVLHEAGQTGLHGVVYRSLKDTYMDPSNYFGHAESHWGLKKSDGAPKPAYGVWKREAAGAAEPAPTPAPAPAPTPAPAPAPSPNVPGSFEAEAMSATAGGRRTDAAASGGAAWNLWSNGELRTTLVSESAADVRLHVVALGQPAGGVNPRMEVRLNGATLAAFSVAGGAYREHAVDARLPAGSSALSVAYTNDAIVNGTDRNLIVDVVRAGPVPNLPPTASFTSAVANLSASFDASASRDPEGQPLSYAWSFGDGTTGAGVRATHAYAQGGDYLVTLTVGDGKSTATASATVRAVRPNAAPTAAFSTAMSNLTLRVDASASSDADGDALTYAWSFGDGSNATGRAATHAYAQAGEYAVTLSVHDGKAFSSATTTVRAVRPNAAPTAAFTSAGEGLTVRFDASGSADADGDALTYAWDFGDGSTLRCDQAGCDASGDGAKGTGAQATHAYAAPGAYAVTLTVSDGKASATAKGSASATYPLPVASFRISGGGLVFVFDAAPSEDPAGGSLTYQWAFGDGGTATGVSARHVYAAPGPYAVTLTVMNRFGGSDAETSAVRAETYAATFTPKAGNEWWVQTDVASNERTVAVCASVNGGACQPLALKSWGDWAESFFIPKGARVVFKATSETGATATSAAYAWPTATPYMTATFRPSGNVWWVQTAVSATSPLESVCASVNGGACQPLALKSWGEWAASLRAPKGSKVVFTATSTLGEKVVSPAYAWPPAR